MQRMRTELFTSIRTEAFKIKTGFLARLTHGEMVLQTPTHPFWDAMTHVRPPVNLSYNISEMYQQGLNVWIDLFEIAPDIMILPTIAGDILHQALKMGGYPTLEVVRVLAQIQSITARSQGKPDGD